MADQRLVQLALERGWITDLQVGDALDRQRVLADRGIDRSLWLMLQDLEYLTEKQALELQRCTSSSEINALHVGRWEMQGRLGSGGMGDVFLGVGDDGSEVAIKLMPERLMREEEYIGRFQRECRALAHLDHPHITGFIDSGQVSRRPYLVMELVRGQSLKQRIQEGGAITERECRQVMTQMAQALSVAAEVGITHRDVKPANIILGPPRPGVDEDFCAKLCDFGLAKFQSKGTGETSMLTRTGIAIGTPHYMSPEQATGDRSADPRHDIYGLAATAYHALLGKTLYSGRSSAVIMYKQATARLDMEPLAERGISSELIVLLKEMLAKPRERRISDWQLCRDRIAALPPLSGQRPASSRPDRGGLSPRPPTDFEPADVVDPMLARQIELQRRRSVLRLAGLAAAVVCLVAGLLLTVLHDGAAPPEQRVGPEGLAVLLAQLAARGQPATVLLEPGLYRGPWLFDESHSGLRLQATGPGVRLSGRTAPQQPVVRVRGPVRGLELHGLIIERTDGVAIRVEGPAALGLTGCIINDADIALEIEGAARVVAEGLRISGSRQGLVLGPGADLVLSDSVIAARRQTILARGAALRGQGLRLVAEGGEAVPGLHLRGGTVALRRMLVLAPERALAVHLEGLGWAELTDLRIEAGREGLRCEDSSLADLRRVSIEAGSLGLQWRGPRDESWLWSDLLVQAPTAVTGLEGLVIDGSGIDQAVLDLLP